MNISAWSDIFDEADNDTKKMILARMIERIEVDRDYHLTIRFFLTANDFRKEEGSGGENGTVRLQEAENPAPVISSKAAS